jgi:hypothetical protein
MKMKPIIKDSDLSTPEAITERILSINKQIEKEEARDLTLIKNHGALDLRIKKLNERKEVLWVRRAKILRITSDKEAGR